MRCFVSLVGIIWDVRHPKAMIKDKDGQTHIVGPNTRVGQNGKPLSGDPELSTPQRAVITENISKVRSVVDKIQRWNRYNENNDRVNHD